MAELPPCTDTDLNMWFPEGGESADPALRVCLAVCAAFFGEARLDACAAANDAHEQACVDAGIVGGLTPNNRRDIRAGRTSAAVARARHRRRLHIPEVAA